MKLYASTFSNRHTLDILAVWAERAERFPAPEPLPPMPEPLPEGEELTPEYETAVAAATPTPEWLAAKALSEPVPADWAGDAEYYAYETTLPPAVAWDEVSRPGPGVRRKQTWIVEKLTGDALSHAAAHARASDLAANDTEAQRRIAALMGQPPATDFDSLRRLVVKQLNANARATELADKRQDSPLTTAEKAEQTQLKGLFAKVKALRDVEKARADEIAATGTAKTAWPTT